MAEIKYLPYIKHNNKTFLVTQSVSVKMNDGISYAGVIRFIFTKSFALETEELGTIDVYVSEIKDIDSI